VLDRLAALVDKGLVLAEEIQGSTRYRLLETVRHYAAERLARRPGSEPDQIRAAHRDHYLALVETAGLPEIPGSLLTFSVTVRYSWAKTATWTTPSLTRRKPLPCHGRPENYRLAITLANFGVDEMAAGELEAARAHLQEANICRVRGHLPARPRAHPGRRHRPGHHSSRARS
jgi:hypothetical protein